MSKNILIDSAHVEEVRVAVVDGERLDKFDFKAPSKAQIKGNIYLGKIIRVEPSLQAAFVDYGGEKHGFLSFNEIHNSYFQIPIGDRQNLEEHLQNAIAARVAEKGGSEEELDPKEISRLRYQFYRHYKIQEVIKKRQIMLLQIIKEERNNKGAALTTYISLAGRYCVLLPNTTKGSGISRKVTNNNDRKKLKEMISELRVDNGSMVIRTAGIGRTKSEIKKDFDYLMKLWDEIRETTLKSEAPSLIHEEASIIKRSIRDMYSPDMESILVEGEEGYKIARNFVKKLMPGHLKKVKLYNDKKLSLFSKFGINDQINQIYSTRVDLPSGGYLIINTTEALISIDVNSGKSTRERNVAGTALKTNLEASAEIARQCRLRDLAGLIVIDFIDMEDKQANAQVERHLKEALHADKARIQVGTISNFGLLELSRQRLRSSIADANMITCPHCNGAGSIWSGESIAIQVLRKIEEASAAFNSGETKVTLSTNVALYIMNNKRSFISDVENNRNLKIIFNIDNSIVDTDFKIEQIAKQGINYDDSDGKNEPLDSEKLKKENEEAVAVLETSLSPAESGNVDTPTSRKNKNRRKRKRDENRKRKNDELSKVPQSLLLEEIPVKGEEHQRNVKNTENSRVKKEKAGAKSNKNASKGEKESVLSVLKVPSTTKAAESNKIAEPIEKEATDSVPRKERSNEKKKKGWWQKLLTPDDEG